MKRAMRLFVSIAVVLTMLFMPLGLPPDVGGPTAVYADDGLAQLEIVTQYPIETLTVVGANQNDDAVTWECGYTDECPNEPVSINDWWWRFKWYCPWWSLFCDEDDYPPPDRISPYVWVRYVDGTLEHKRCVPDDFNEDTDWVTCEFSYAGDELPPPPPSDHYVILDPGHGGTDPGAPNAELAALCGVPLGPDDKREKDVTLESSFRWET